MVSTSVGTALIMLLIFWMVSRCRGHRITSKEMEQALKAQRERFWKEEEPLPVIPSVHANRLGVHEHPAVRDQFGMKKHYDVTPGEGFHVKRITRDGSAKSRTTSRDIEEGDGKVPQSEGHEGMNK